MARLSDLQLLKTMRCTEILREMICVFEKDLAKYRAGNRTDYCYQQIHTEQYGNTDAHAENRARLCYGLLFDKTLPEPEREQRIRELFAEEITANENESFQGISSGLQILSFLLLPYQKPEDEALFARAKHANFDCACGYAPDVYEYSDDPETYSPEDCADIAAGTGLQEYLCELLDLVKADAPDLDTCKHWQYYADMTNRAEDRAYFVQRIFDLTAQNTAATDMDRLLAYKKYILYLAECGDAAGAYASFRKGRQYLCSANKTALYQTAKSIMLADAQYIPQVWQDIRSDTRRWLAKGTLYPVCFSLAAECAEIAGDAVTAETIKNQKQS